MKMLYSLVALFFTFLLFFSIPMTPFLSVSAVEEPAASWQYRRTIIIQEKSGKTLIDYQIPITIDTASLINDGKMRGDCGDIQFTDSDGKNISYWIESGMDSDSTKIWVKVPRIRALQTKTIYMYYGNPKATSTSNKTATLEFFENFEGSFDWEYVETDPNFAHAITTNCRLHLYFDGDGLVLAGAYAQIHRSITLSSLRPILISFYYYSTNMKSIGYCDKGLLVDEILLWSEDTYVNRDTWQKMDLPYQPSSSVITLKLRIQTLAMVMFGASRDYGCYWDDIMIRKYANPEPTILMGPEESAPFAPPFAPLGYLQVMVKDNSTGKPITGAYVTITELEGRIGTTDVNGTSIFWGVPIGNYTVSAKAPGYIASSKPVIISENKVATLTIDLQPLYSISITIQVGTKSYLILIDSNSTLSNFESNSTAFWFEVSGSSAGYCNVTLPQALNTTNIKVYFDSQVLTPTISQNATHYFIYFTYSLSPHTITIIFAKPTPDYTTLYIIVIVVAIGAIIAAVTIVVTRMRKKTSYEYYRETLKGLEKGTSKQSTSKGRNLIHKGKIWN